MTFEFSDMGEELVGGPSFGQVAEILFQAKPHGAQLYYDDGVTPIPGQFIPGNRQIGGTLRFPSSGQTLVEVSSGGYTGWGHYGDFIQLGSLPARTGYEELSGCGYEEVSGPSFGQVAEILFQAKPQGAQLYYDDGVTPIPGQFIPGNRQIGGTLRFPSSGQTLVEVSSGGYTGWGHYGDFIQLGSPPARTGYWFPQEEYGGNEFAGFEEYVGAEMTHPAQAAAANAANAQAQAQSALQAAAHPAAKASQTAQLSAQTAQTHAQVAQTHAHAAQNAPSFQAAQSHALQANQHAQLAAHHTLNAHGEARHGGARHVYGGRHPFGGRHGGWHGREHGWHGREHGWGHGRGWGGRHGWGRGWGGWRRDLYSEWYGFGHPGWRRGILPIWANWRAECHMRSPWGICFKEMITSPQGYVVYRITPAGMQQSIVLEDDEQSANDQYFQQVGTAAPDQEAGLLPGSEQTSDGSTQPTDADTQQAAAPAADADAAATDDDAVADEKTGWEMLFTDPYGYLNPYLPPAYDTRFLYGPRR